MNQPNLDYTNAELQTPPEGMEPKQYATTYVAVLEHLMALDFDRFVQDNNVPEAIVNDDFERVYGCYLKAAGGEDYIGHYYGCMAYEIVRGIAPHSDEFLAAALRREAQQAGGLN